MSISKDDIKRLREQTGCGIGDCKSALDEAKGDYNKAIEFLKEKGLAKAIKKSEREVSEGKIFVYTDTFSATLVKIECETDFVSNTDDFRSFGKVVAENIHKKNITSIENIDKELSNLVAQTILKLNENIKIGTIVRMNGTSSTPVIPFIQMGKDGALVKFELDKDSPNTKEFNEVLEDIAITGSFYKPMYVMYEQVPQNEIEEEKKIISAQMKEDPSFSDKPANVLENILSGKVKKAFNERVFMELPFYKEQSKKINDIINEASKKFGIKIKIQQFTFVKVGE